MLGKLMKYELRAKRGVYIGMYIFVLVASLITIGITLLCEAYPGNILLTTFRGLMTAAMVLAVVAMFTVTMIMSILRYYENLVKDEGYLMHTIPVSMTSIHLVKVITPMIWYAIDTVLAFVAVIAVTGDYKFEWVGLVKQIIEATDVAEFTSVAVIFVIYMVLATIASLSIYYACINLGSLSVSNKGAMAFVAYIVLYMINQVISGVATVILMVVLYAGEGGFAAAMNSEVMPDGYFEGVFITSGIIALISIVAYNWISLHILKNKVNLE